MRISQAARRWSARRASAQPTLVRIHCSRHIAIHTIFETPCCARNVSPCVRMPHCLLMLTRRSHTSSWPPRHQGHKFSTRPLQSSARVGCAFLVESPVRVLIMTPGPGSDHVRCPPPQDPITGAFAVSTIAWDRCCWVREGQRPKQRAEWRRFE